MRARRQSGARRKHCTTGTPIIAGARRKPAISDPDYQIQTSQQTAESRTLAAMGAEVILHPTPTDTVDRDVELAIARASAAMNQVYLFGINAVGDGGVGCLTVVDPLGHVLHQAAAGPKIMPFEVDLLRLRRERERGMRSLDPQPLKSFHDRACEFTVYRQSSDYLDSLGPLALPR